MWKSQGLLTFFPRSALIWKKSGPKVFNWSEFHFSEVTSYKIQTLGVNVLYRYVTTQNQIDLQRKTYFCFISKKKNRESKVRSQKFTVIFSFIINIFQFLKYTWTLFAIFFRNWKNKNRKKCINS